MRVVSLAQAVERGLSASTVQRRARTGSWERLHPGIYLVGGHRYTDEVRVRAAGPGGGARSAVTGPAAASAAERLLVALLRGASIRGWVLAFRFGPYIVDLAFSAPKVAVEVDGWAWHVDVERFRADRRKGNALVSAGWDLLRFTWHDLDARADQCSAELRDVLASAA